MMNLKDIDDRYSAEMLFVVMVCRVWFHQAGPGELADFLYNHKLDWKQVGRIIKVHQIRPLVYKVLSANPTNIDEIFLEDLKNKCFWIASGNLQKLDEQNHLFKLLKAKGISILPYKGVILSQLLFGDYISRETSDIDFLILAKDFRQVMEVLIEEGYTTPYYNLNFERQILKTSNELTFSKVSDGVELKIEIHWELTNRMMDIPLPISDIFQKKKIINIRGQETNTIENEMYLLMLLAHHGGNDVWRVLRHCLDISLFVEKYGEEIDWARFHALTQKYRIRKTTETGYYICHQLFGTNIPELFKSEDPKTQVLIDNLLSFPPINRIKFTRENLKQHLFLRDSTVDKLRLIGSYIKTGFVPNIHDMEALNVGKNWYFLYYFIKPYRLVFNRK